MVRSFPWWQGRARSRGRWPGIEFDNVGFTYPGGAEPAVAALNLHIRNGELVALVGENGAGKSTIVKLLLRHYDPDQNPVRVGGVAGGKVAELGTHEELLQANVRHPQLFELQAPGYR